MSNYLAIATVSATLGQLLQGPVGSDIPGATVRFGKPETVGTGTSSPQVSLYLYQVTPNGAYRNADFPTRRSDGQLAQHPRVALDLHYLLSFSGDEGLLEPERLLGSVARTIHARPVLTRPMIRDTIANPAFSFLAASNLADEIELVKFTPLSLSLEELSKLWSVFFQIPYTLSVAYQGTVVLIESEDTPQPTLPVRERNVYAVPFKSPTVEQVTSQAGESQQIVASSRLLINGKQLRGDVTLILLGGTERFPSTCSDTQITMPVPSDLRAGPQGLQVLHQMMIGTPAAPHRGVQSNVAAFILCPQITSVSASSTQVTLQVTPTVGTTQRVTLLLSERSTTSPVSYTFSAPTRSGDTSTLQFPVSGVKTATEYFIRIQVDGAESPLDLDVSSATFGPTVVVP